LRSHRIGEHDEPAKQMVMQLFCINSFCIYQFIKRHHTFIAISEPDLIAFDHHRTALIDKQIGKYCSNNTNMFDHSNQNRLRFVKKWECSGFIFVRIEAEHN